MLERSASYTNHWTSTGLALSTAFTRHSVDTRELLRLRSPRSFRRGAPGTRLLSHGPHNHRRCASSTHAWYSTISITFYLPAAWMRVPAALLEAKLELSYDPLRTKETLRVIYVG